MTNSLFYCQDLRRFLSLSVFCSLQQLGSFYPHYAVVRRGSHRWCGTQLHQQQVLYIEYRQYCIYRYFTYIATIFIVQLLLLLVLQIQLVQYQLLLFSIISTVLPSNILDIVGYPLYCNELYSLLRYTLLLVVVSHYQSNPCFKQFHVFITYSTGNILVQYGSVKGSYYRYSTVLYRTVFT